MGMCNSTFGVPIECEQAARQAKQIEQKEILRKNQDVVVLGPAESGKSTLVKQIKLMSDPYTRQDLIQKREEIIQNLYAFFRMLLDHARKKGQEEDGIRISEEDDSKFEKLSGIVNSDDPKIEELAEELIYFWNTDAIQRAYENRKKFKLPDSARYFFENIHRLKEPGYMPTIKDIMLIQVPTSDIIQAEVFVRDVKLRIFDFPGRRQERQKWLQHFVGKGQTVVFVAAISEYDQVLEEDGSINRMKEAISLFRAVFAGRYFNDASIIVFLNKVDIFREKVRTIPINSHFSEFKRDNTAELGVEFFKQEFKAALPEKRRDALYIHEISSVSESVPTIMNTAIDTVLQYSNRTATL